MSCSVHICIVKGNMSLSLCSFITWFKNQYLYPILITCYPLLLCIIVADFFFWTTNQPPNHYMETCYWLWMLSLRGSFLGSSFNLACFSLSRFCLGTFYLSLFPYVLYSLFFVSDRWLSSFWLRHVPPFLPHSLLLLLLSNLISLPIYSPYSLALPT